MKKNIFLLLFTLFSFSAIHAKIDWKLENGTLTISGQGDMDDYEIFGAPWYNDWKKISNVVIKDGVTSIGKNAFYECESLTSITIPNSVTSIGNYAFSHCYSLTSITIPNSVTSIGEFAFFICKALTSVIIPNSVTSIGKNAFMQCFALTSVEIPNSVTSIEDWTFFNCSALTSVVIPNSVTSIGISAFCDCSALTSVVIPNSVTSIGFFAFCDCSALTSITFKGSTPPVFGENVFNNVNRSVSIYVPYNSIEAYKKALGDLGMSNIQANPKQLFLTDDEAYTRESDSEGVDVSYTRNFTNVNWQAIYLPFSLNYEDLKDDFELAYINTVHQNDNDEDGVIDETVMEIIKMKSGSTQPNMPYLIRAKTAGEKTISAENTTIYAAESGSVDCSTTIAKYTIIGTYSPIPSETMIANNYYGMGGGELIQSDGSNGLKPFRWYMKVESRDYSKYSVKNAAKSISIKVLDEETTGIANIQHPSPNTQIFDINGRKMNENSLKPGIYVKNGKKFVVK